MLAIQLLSATPLLVKGRQQIAHVAEYEQHLNFPQLMVIVIVVSQLLVRLNGMHIP